MHCVFLLNKKKRLPYHTINCLRRPCIFLTLDKQVQDLNPIHLVRVDIKSQLFVRFYFS